MFDRSPTWQETALLLSVPHVYYLVLWFYPKLWCRFSRNLKFDPCTLMCTVAVLLKVEQIGVWLWFYFSHVPLDEDVVTEVLRHGGFQRVFVASTLAVVGQILNFGATRALGVNGIYYGYRFGKTIPWCTHWPYGGMLRVPHPQYVGAILSIFGVTLLTATHAHAAAGLRSIMFAWCGYFLVNGITEEIVHRRDSGKAC